MKPIMLFTVLPVPSPSFARRFQNGIARLIRVIFQNSFGFEVSPYHDRQDALAL